MTSSLGLGEEVWRKVGRVDYVQRKPRRKAKGYGGRTRMASKEQAETPAAT